MTIHDDTVVGNVALERARQNEKWGEQDRRDGTGPAEIIADLPVLESAARMDHMREWAQSTCGDAFYDGEGRWAHILLEKVFEALAEDDEVRLVTELVQVAAVAEQWAAEILRRLDARNRTPRGQ